MSQTVKEFWKSVNICPSYGQLSTGLLFYETRYSNFVPNTHRFLDIRLQQYCDLENRVRNRSRSFEISLTMERVWLPIDVL